MSNSNELPLPGKGYHGLFDYLHHNHNLVLLESEINDLVNVVHKFYPQERSETPHKASYIDQWETFWKSIVCNPDGSINIDQVKKELHDFSYLLEQIPKVYCHITGNRMSKVFYPAETVISVADDYQQGLIDEAVKDELGERETTGAVWQQGEYNRLYDQLKADPEKRIACFVDYDGFSRRYGGDPCRDICAVKGSRMEFSARGIGYGGAESWLDEGDKKEAFLKDCQRLNVTWLDESGQTLQQLHVRYLKMESALNAITGKTMPVPNTSDMIEIATKALNDGCPNCGIENCQSDHK